jgi:transcriptional regulator with XRE-family HTH domain
MQTHFKDLRETAGLTLEQVSKITGYAVSAINGLENHDRGSKHLRAKLLEIYNPGTVSGGRLKRESHRENNLATAFDALQKIQAKVKSLEGMKPEIARLESALQRLVDAP